MGRSVHNDVLDAAHDLVKQNADKMVACSQEPTTFLEANSTFALADVATAPGDFTIADGDVSGRKLTVGAKSGVTVDTTGTFTHVALIDTVTSRLLRVTVGTSQALTAGNTVNFPAFDFEIEDPAAP